MQYVLLTPGQPPEVVNNAETLSYDQLVAIVGYPLEVLTIMGGKARLYMCEEGKQRNFPLNESATRLANGAIDPTDYVVGTALVVGPPYAGEDTALSDEVVADLVEALR